MSEWVDHLIPLSKIICYRKYFDHQRKYTSNHKEINCVDVEIYKTIYTIVDISIYHKNFVFFLVRKK